MNADAVRMRRKQELFGVLWAFIGLFFVLCFLSFSPKDPCLLIREGQTGPASNWMGPVGATLAGWLFGLIGLSAWLIPFGIGALAAWSFQGKMAPDRPGRKRHLWLRSTGIVVLVFSTAIFLGLALGRFTYDGESFRAGGIVGAWLAGILTDLIGLAGAFCTVILITIIALMAAFDFSPVRAASLLADLFFWAREAVGDMIVRRTEARKRRKEVAFERVQLEKTRALAPIKIVDKKPAAPAVIVAKPKPEKKPRQQKFEFAREGDYELPGIDLLDEVPSGRVGIDKETLLMNAKILENKLKDYGVQGEVVEVHPGPVVTMYEYRPGSGVKINKIANLADDLAMALSALSIRIIAPIPGKNVVGIEISNRERETVYLREIVETEDFNKMKSALPMALGKDTVGVPYAFDMRKAPHLLVAGSTGSGKSVGLNSMIMSVLLRSTPDQVKIMMIDPKRLELSIYEGIPHLLHPVIADAKDAALSLKWAVAEMERRYKLLAEQGVRHVDSYNRLVGKDPKELKKESKKKKKKSEAAPAKEADTVVLVRPEGEASGSMEDKKEVLPPTEHLPLILIVIDELADLMMVAPKDVEESICRLAQMARAAGIHLILATQRPSVDVITGLIKANFPSRLAFRVSSKVDSRTILDQNGAERLLGAGDMLFSGPGTSQVERLHGAFVSDQEIKEVTGFLREQGRPDYNEDILKFRAAAKDEEDSDAEPRDDKWDDAVAVAVSAGQVSVSMLQRKLKIGYNRAARIIENMEAEGMVGPSDGVKPRQVLVDAYAGMESSMA